MIIREDINAIFLDPFGDKQWTTGGEKRFRKIEEYLKKYIMNVNVISFADFPFEVNAKRFLRTNVKIFQILKSKYSFNKRSVFIYPNTCSLFVFLAVIIMRIICNIKIIMTVEHFKDPLYPSIKSFLSRGLWLFPNIVCVHCSHMLIVVSKSTEKECKQMGVNAIKIKIVPNGIEKVKYHENIIGIEKQNEIINILFIGYCGRIKGLQYLVEAMMVLKRQGINNYYLHIVGDTKKDQMYFSEIQKFIYENSLNDRIKFYGPMYENNLDRVWGKANIFILPSLWESYGLVIVEAMSRGIPVIATNVGAIPELVTDGISGLIVPPKDSYALAEAIQKLSLDISLQNNVIAGGHRIAENSLSWEESCEECYQQIVSIFNAQSPEKGRLNL